MASPFSGGQHSLPQRHLILRLIKHKRRQVYAHRAQKDASRCKATKRPGKLYG
jgi:hypothetical protein